jgi:hypothetical protein
MFDQQQMRQPAAAIPALTLPAKRNAEGDLIAGRGAALHQFD